MYTAYLLIFSHGHVKNYKSMATFVGLWGDPGVQAYSVACWIGNFGN